MKFIAINNINIEVTPGMIDRILSATDETVRLIEKEIKYQPQFVNVDYVNRYVAHLIHLGDMLIKAL